MQRNTAPHFGVAVFVNNVTDMAWILRWKLSEGMAIEIVSQRQGCRSIKARHKEK
jgi:hypothetical protein